MLRVWGWYWWSSWLQSLLSQNQSLSRHASWTWQQKSVNIMMTSYVPLFVFVFVSIIFSFCEANFALVFLTSWVPATRCQSWKWFPLVVHSHKTAGWWQDFLAFNLKHESRRTFLEVEINQSFADTWYIWRCIVFWKEIKKMINL